MDDLQCLTYIFWFPWRVLFELYMFKELFYSVSQLFVIMWICIVSSRNLIGASDENLSASGRQRLASSQSGAGQRSGLTNKTSPSSTFQEDLMRLIDPDVSFSEPIKFSEVTLYPYLGVCIFVTLHYKTSHMSPFWIFRHSTRIIAIGYFTLNKCIFAEISENIY